MILYRISTKKRAGDLSGTGAKLFGGRWNSPGNPVLYTAQSVSLAMLETLVHAEREALRQTYSLTSVAVPDKMQVQEVEIRSLPDLWRGFPFDQNTVQTGNKWLKEQSSVILKVPSAVNPHEFNFLLNPLHPDFSGISIQDIQPISFDLRLR